MPYHTSPRVLRVPCTQPDCRHFLRSFRGRTAHIQSAHPVSTPPPSPSGRQDVPGHFSPPRSPDRSDSPPPSPTPSSASDEIDEDGWAKEDFDIDGLPGPSNNIETDANMQFYGPHDKYYRRHHSKLTGTPPAASVNDQNNWFPYDNQVQFETAEFLYSKCHLSANKIDALLDLWAASLYPHGAEPPFKDHHHLHKVIDAMVAGDIKWQCFSVNYTGEIPTENPPDWMLNKYDVWFRDPRQVVHKILGNPSFTNEMDLSPFKEYSTDDQTQQYKDFMSGDWAWKQADIIAKGDESTVGSTLVPIILGSDKTTVLVATSNNKYYPLYLSVGNVRNNVRRAHRDAVVLIDFLAIPKTTNEHSSDANFRVFHRQLFHSSLSFILQSLKPAMTTPEVVKYGDGFFRRTIYSLGPYIADYEEQVLLTCIVCGWCARCCAPRNNLDEDALDRTHEFNEALFEETDTDMMWTEYGIVGDLVSFTNDFPRANIHQLIAPDILHQLIKGCFKDHLNANRILDDIDCRHFKQWTGDDSKALMKVYIAAIKGYIPAEIVRTLRALLDFCYLVRRHIISAKALQEIEDALTQFYNYRQVFMSGDKPVVATFSLPRQHAAKHYPSLICLFGAPNGLCSSITECKHIKAVKEPWRRSNKFQALGQMLRTNQRLNKIAAAHIDFESRKMLRENCLSSAIDILDRCFLVDLTWWFLFGQYNPDDAHNPMEICLSDCPRYDGRINVYNSACARFFAPSDLSGIGGMQKEFIRSTPVWRKEGSRKDCVFVTTNADDLDATDMHAFDIARILAFFTFTCQDGKHFPCAVVHANLSNCSPYYVVIHLDSIYCAAHLIPVYGMDCIPRNIKPHNCYDAFRAFYVNKYVNHHAFEIAS
ncbi:hypothetical protein EV363DRAFT_1164456 [Boletus edulis]|nr:hypothetical protein EV363DRAFT_1164456 [Boletus edulis]